MARNKRRKRSGNNRAERLARDPLPAREVRTPTEVLFNVLFWGVLLCAVILLIYKADFTGMSYDEYLSFMRYTKDVYTATHRFDSTNNHVLNSIFMHYAKDSFGSYEQFIRIPSLAAGIIFMLAASYIIRKTVRSNILRIVSLLMVCFSGAYFSYLFMARGYAYALASFAVYIAVVQFLLTHKLSFRYWFPVAIVLSFLNFMAIGSLLSSVLVMIAINGVFILLYSPRIFKDVSGKLKPAIVMFVSILCATSAMLHLLFRAIYKNLFSLENNYDLVAITHSWKGWPTLAVHLKSLLMDKIFVTKTGFGKVVLYISLSVIAISFLFYIYRMLRSFKERKAAAFFADVKLCTFPLASMFLSVIVLIIYGVFLDRCPGLIRSNILLTPLVILAAIGLLDWFVHAVPEGRYRLSLIVFVAALIFTVFVRRAPSFISSGRMLMSRPVLTKLAAYDPDKVWNISFSKKLWDYRVGFLYYKQFDRKFNIVPANKCNAYVCNIGEVPEGAILLDNDYFSKSGFSVVLNIKTK